MKVKELAENLKISTDELIKSLSNVIFTEAITSEYDVSKDMEKKLAKLYGVPYPFKTSKPKPTPKAPEKPVQSKTEKAPVKPTQMKTKLGSDAKQPVKGKPTASNNKATGINKNNDHNKNVATKPVQKPSQNHPTVKKEEHVQPKPVVKNKFQNMKMKLFNLVWMKNFLKNMVVILKKMNTI